MIVLGVVLLLLGLLVPQLAVLTTIGVVVIIIGILLWIVPIGGYRRRWY